ncbi:hypothetical protein JCM10213_001665 [Rhodosporidiobolus nylandii]
MLQPTPVYLRQQDSLYPSRFQPSAPSSSSISPASMPSNGALPYELHSYLVIGGGTGCNAVASAFQGRKTTFVVPVSDDGGSSSEIQRVLGGPALGDIRSRLTRLIPSSPANPSLNAIRRLMEYRLPGGAGVSGREVKAEWAEIVEGSHRLWRGIPGDRKETIRAFLVHFQSAVLKKAQRGFNFKRASIGNLFLSGASLFLGSVPSAIFLFASLTSISLDSLNVLPVINTSSSVTIAAELEDGRIIAGQSEISHPSSSTLFAASQAAGNAEVGHVNGAAVGMALHPSSASSVGGYFPLTRATTPSFPDPPVLGAEEDDDLSLSLSPASPDPSTVLGTPNPNGGGNLEFSKDAAEVPPLESRIRRVFYLNAYGTEIYPRPNGLVLEGLREASCLIYAPGSLYTSILPCLELRPVGRLIASSSSPFSPSSSSSFPSSAARPPPLQYKVLLLNSVHDRETPDYTAADFVSAIREACERSSEEGEGAVEARAIITHVVYLRGGEVRVDEEALRTLGIVPVPCGPTQSGLFDDEVVREALGRIFSGEAR